ncbi:MAG: hypothetical protein WBY71_08500 [Nitrososphaeraceae archaeon]
MQCLKIELHAVTAVVLVVVAAAVLYLPIEIKKSRKMILQGEN